MGGRLVAQAAEFGRLAAAGGLFEMRDFAGQVVDLLLLAHDDSV